MSQTAQAKPKRRTKREPAVVIFRNVPPSYNWGFFSREDPRMHIQVLDRRHHDLGYKVWLERDAQRVIEPEPGIPAKVWKPLHAKIVQRRGMIEAEWIGLMMANGWLELHVAPPIVTLVAYPRQPHRFFRTLDLREDFVPEVLATITPSDVVFNHEFAVLEIFPKRPETRRHHFRLEPILWT